MNYIPLKVELFSSKDKKAAVKETLRKEVVSFFLYKEKMTLSTDKCHSGLHTLRKINTSRKNELSFSAGKVILQTIVCSDIFAKGQK